MRTLRTVRLASLFLTSLFALPLALAACGGDDQEDAEPFDTLQDCFDEHHGEESLPTAQAIVVCCLDHPIAGVHPSCGNSAAECTAHVDMELDSSVSASDISAACADYIDQK